VVVVEYTPCKELHTVDTILSTVWSEIETWLDKRARAHRRRGEREKGTEELFV